MDVLRVVTSGSVDDGKSTLIGRLLHDSGQVADDILQSVQDASQKRGLDHVDLSLITDGLLAEREQGITIDVAYRYFQTPARKYIIADCPGHRQYTRNMVTGASNADIAILLVDATRGLTEQTRRHAAICGWLEVPHVVLAVNKLDRAGWSEAVFERIESEFRQWCAPLLIERVDAIPMAALDGDMIVRRGSNLPWYKGATIMETLAAAKSAQSPRSIAIRTSVSVQAVNRSNPKTFDGNLRGYAGRISGDSIAVGDEVAVLPAGQFAKVEQLWIGNRAVEKACAGASVLIRLDRDLAICRGDVLVKGTGLESASTLRAELAWFASDPLQPGQQYTLKIGTRTVRGLVGKVLSNLDLGNLQEQVVDRVNQDDLATIELELDESVSAAVDSCRTPLGRFILFDQSSGNTVGAGKIKSLLS